MSTRLKIISQEGLSLKLCCKIIEKIINKQIFTLFTIQIHNSIINRGNASRLPLRPNDYSPFHVVLSSVPPRQVAIV